MACDRRARKNLDPIKGRHIAMRCNLIPAMMKLLSAGGAVAATTPGIRSCNRDNDRHVISALVRQGTRQGLERAGQNDMAVDVFKDSYHNYPHAITQTPTHTHPHTHTHIHKHTHTHTHTHTHYYHITSFFPSFPFLYWRVRMVMIPRPQVGGVMSGPATTVASAMPL